MVLGADDDRVSALFLKYDRQKTDQMSTAELPMLLADLSIRPTRAVVQEATRSLDRTGSGVIGLNRFLGWYKAEHGAANTGNTTPAGAVASAQNGKNSEEEIERQRLILEKSMRKDMMLRAWATWRAALARRESKRADEAMWSVKHTALAYSHWKSIALLRSLMRRVTYRLDEMGSENDEQISELQSAAAVAEAEVERLKAQLDATLGRVDKAHAQRDEVEGNLNREHTSFLKLRAFNVWAKNVLLAKTRGYFKKSDGTVKELLGIVNELRAEQSEDLKDMGQLAQAKVKLSALLQWKNRAVMSRIRKLWIQERDQMDLLYQRNNAENEEHKALAKEIVLDMQEKMGAALDLAKVRENSVKAFCRWKGCTGMRLKNEKVLKKVLGRMYHIHTARGFGAWRTFVTARKIAQRMYGRKRLTARQNYDKNRLLKLAKYYALWNINKTRIKSRRLAVHMVGELENAQEQMKDLTVLTTGSERSRNALEQLMDDADSRTHMYKAWSKWKGCVQSTRYLLLAQDLEKMKDEYREMLEEFHGISRAAESKSRTKETVEAMLESSDEKRGKLWGFTAWVIAVERMKRGKTHDNAMNAVQQQRELLDDNRNLMDEIDQLKREIQTLNQTIEERENYIDVLKSGNKDLQSEVEEKRAYQSAEELRLMGRYATSFCKWKQLVRETQWKKREILKRTRDRMAFSVKLAFDGWHNYTNIRREHYESTRQKFFSKLLHDTKWCLRDWKEYTWNNKRTKVVLWQTMHRIRNSKVLAVWNKWVLFTHDIKVLRVMARKALLKIIHFKMTRAFNRWIATENEFRKEKHAKDILVRCFMRMQKAKSYKCFNTWKNNVHHMSTRREIDSKLFGLKLRLASFYFDKLVHNQEAKAFRQWADVAELRMDTRTRLLRIAGKIRHHNMWRAFREWDLAKHVSRFATLRHHVMQKYALKMKQAKVIGAMEAWKDMVRRHRIGKQAMKSCLNRLKNFKVAAAWTAWYKFYLWAKSTNYSHRMHMEEDAKRRAQLDAMEKQLQDLLDRMMHRIGDHLHWQMIRAWIKGSFVHWMEWYQERKRERSVLKKVMWRIINQKVAMAVNKWRETTRQLILDRATSRANKHQSILDDALRELTELSTNDLANDDIIQQSMHQVTQLESKLVRDHNHLKDEQEAGNIPSGHRFSQKKVSVTTALEPVKLQRDYYFSGLPKDEVYIDTLKRGGVLTYHNLDKNPQSQRIWVSLSGDETKLRWGFESLDGIEISDIERIQSGRSTTVFKNLDEGIEEGHLCFSLMMKNGMTQDFSTDDAESFGSTVLGLACYVKGCHDVDEAWVEKAIERQLKAAQVS